MLQTHASGAAGVQQFECGSITTQVHMSNGNISLWELPADLNQPMPKDPVKSCAILPPAADATQRCTFLGMQMLHHLAMTLSCF